MPTATFRVLYVFVVLLHHRRKVVHFKVTDSPTAAWTAQQILEAFPGDSAPRYLLRDSESYTVHARMEFVARTGGSFRMKSVFAMVHAPCVVSDGTPPVFWRSVSVMRSATNSPDANVSAAMSHIAAESPSASAVAPARSAPMA